MSGTTTDGSLQITSEIDAHAEALLRLEALTGESFDRFVFGGRTALADDLQRATFARGVADFAPPAARVLLQDGVAVGMYALLPEPLFRQRRLAAALATMRVLGRDADPALRQRLSLAGSVSLVPAPGDAVIARIAVSPDVAGRGLGHRLLEHAAREARREGAGRLVLDVADDNDVAVRFYARQGFAELGRTEVRDEATERRLAYVHLGRAL